MTTWTALTTLKGKDRAEALGEAMERLQPEPTGVGVFEVEDGSGLWEVGGYFTEQPDEAGLALLTAAFGGGDFVISELPETDWVAKVRRELAQGVEDKNPYGAGRRRGQTFDTAHPNVETNGLVLIGKRGYREIFRFQPEKCAAGTVSGPHHKAVDPQGWPHRLLR